MFHSSSYTDSSLQHFQQAPVYVPTSRGMAGTGYGAGGGSHYQPQTGGWGHPAADPAGYGSTHGLSAAAAHPGAITAAAAAGQFYAQNVMMGGWRAYDSSGFQRTSPYGKKKI